MANLAAFRGKNVLITGGTGSFGQKLARKLLEETLCHKVIIFSRDEWKQWEMRQSDPIFNSKNIRYFLGDVRDPTRLARAFHEVHIVIHAAALKQVPVAEYNPTEFVNTNVLGAMNVINAAIDAGVEKVVALSTDKAVNPINLYGATKLCSDKLFVAGNAYVGARGYPGFSVVRYGNVLGSRGSIIPFWQKLLAEGAKSIPITDKRMTRFWITLDESVDFVTRCLARSKGGEVFIPKIPSMKLVDLAEAIAPKVPHEFVGIRPGEKLHEVMVSGEDARHTLEYDDSYVILPQIIYHKPSLLEKLIPGMKGKPVPEGFFYSSNTNDQWLSVEDLKKILSK